MGINFPTAFIALLTLSIWLAVASIFSTPQSKSFKELVVWFLDPVAGPVAVVIVFACLLVCNIRKVIHQDRSVRANLKLKAELDTSFDDRIKSFLENHLNQACYGIAECYVFGSVVQQYPNRDVDIVVQFDSSKPGQIRTCRNRLRKLETSFEKFHCLKLHVQTFLITESEAMKEFLAVAGRHERLL